MGWIQEPDVRRISYGVIEDYDPATSPFHAENHTLTGATHTASGLTTGDFLEATAATTFGFVTRFLRAYKSSDETVTDTTLQADDALTLTLAASSKYLFRVVGFHTNAGATEGFQVALDGTVGVTSLKAQIFLQNALFSSSTFGRVEALTTAVGGGMTAADHYFTVDGTIETSTAGTLFVSWAQNATGASAGVTVERNSIMTAWLVG